MKKKIVSIILVLVMVLDVMIVASMASASAAVEKGSKIKVWVDGL